MGVASLILGIISIIIGFIPLCGSIAFLPALIGLILGIIDIVKKNKTEEKKGQSIAGIILSVIAIVCIVFWLGIGLTSEDSNNETISTSAKSENKATEVKETKEQYIASCLDYKYKDLARNPNEYKGKRIKFTGEVIQVQEGFLNSVVLRVNVTKNEYDFWEDTVYVEYTYSNSNESKILEDDIIDLYGEYKGLKSYTSVLGSTVTIPEVEAKYINIK